jgi:hypothetical protein
MGWNLKTIAAAYTDNMIIDAYHVVSQFPEQRPVTLVGATRWTVLLYAPNPANLILVAMATLRTAVGRRLQFLTFVKELPFVKRHLAVVAGLQSFVLARWQSVATMLSP